MPFCSNCGKELPNPAPNFCPTCGKPTQAQSVPLQVTTSQTPAATPPAVQSKPEMTNRFRIAAALGLLVLLIAIPMPWITINVLGQYNVSLLNIINLFSTASSAPSNTALGSPQLTQVLGNILPSLYALLGALVLYGLSVILGIFSTVSKRLTAPTGVLAILTGILWIAGIESFKLAFVRYLQSLGGGLAGSLGSGFAGLIGGALASAITAGTGVYVVILAGIIFLVARFLK